MGRSKGSLGRRAMEIIETSLEILAHDHPMTVRQLFYQLVSRQTVENSRGAYQAVGNAIVDARLDGRIEWEWIEDRLRQPRSVPMWENVADFGRNIAPQYKRRVWNSQPVCVETWLEKDALSGIFEDVLERYGITLNVGRGYDGWSSIYEASERLSDGDVVLYFGDFDPSGEDMVRSLQERLARLGCEPDIMKVALNQDDITRYNLPPNMTKPKDRRRMKFVEKYGDVSVELDALPASVLRSRIKEAVESIMDMEALEAIEREDEAAQVKIAKSLARIKEA